MQLKLKHTMLFLSLCAAFSACNDRNALDNPTGKTPIELSVGGVDSPEPALTRAVITDGTNKTLNAFDVDTKIFMVMKSEYDTENPDFAGARTTKYNVARGDVTASSTTNITVGGNTVTANNVVFDSKNQRYWDDAHARSSQLSIWAYAQKGQSTWLNCTFNGAQYKTDADATQPYAWTTTEIVPTILTWRASHQDGTEAQNQTSVQAQDLLFSNNLAENGGNDNRLKFNFTTRKFPQVGEANMIFYHAMSKITIKIIEGEGFDKTSANKANDFKFTTTGGNVILKQFNHTGTFDIKQGEFTTIASGGKTDIPSIYLKTTNTSATGTEPHYVLEALAVPSIANDGASRIIDDKKSLSTDVMMEFAIDNNLYQITHDELFEALRDKTNATMMSDNGNYIPLEAGKNYVFTFTIGKTKIKNITAQVVGWEDVVADPFNPSNARIKLQLEERGEPVTAPVDIYRAADNASTVTDAWESYNWTTGYVGNKNVFKEISSVWKLENDWFWDNNMNYYHFRAIMPSGQTVQTDATPNPNEDYVSLSSAVSYTDVLWGAPMRDVANNEDPDDFKFIYDKDKGFDVKNSAVDANKSQIYQAIGPTEDKLKLTLFHMMSDLTIKIKTTTGADAVTLVDGGGNKTKVQLEGHYANGTILLGTGLIKTTGSATATDRSAPAIARNSVDGDYQVYKYGVVPQGLTGVQLRITTPDKNEYIVDLAGVLATTLNTTNIANPYTQSAGKYIIDRWYPGFKYTYTFTLKKKGIVDLQATIVDWENVTAGDDNVQIQ